jgi:hypothetical protein
VPQWRGSVRCDVTNAKNMRLICMHQREREWHEWVPQCVPPAGAGRQGREGGWGCCSDRSLFYKFKAGPFLLYIWILLTFPSGFLAKML